MKQKAYLLLLILISGFLLSSCLEKIEEKEAPLGKAASDQQVSDAIDKATEGVSLWNSKVGHYTEYEYNARIELNSVFRLGKVDRELLAIKENEKTHNFVYLENYFEYEMSGAIKDEWHKEQVIQVAKRMSAFSLVKSNSNFVCDGIDETDSSGDTYDCLKYFNLGFKYMKMDVPVAIKNRANCGGVSGCQLNVRFLAYDEVKWRKNEAVKKAEYKMYITPEVPHLFPESGIPPVLSLCIREIQDFAERKNVLVTSCRVLRDMKLE
jgi:hypothetical protein